MHPVALNVAQVSPEEVVYIGPMLVQVVRGLGFHGSVHTDHEATCKELATFELSLEHT